MKKNILLFISAFAALAAAVSCGKQVNKDIVWPEWASRPIVDNAALKGVDGSSMVVAGDEVTFTASVHDDYNSFTSAILTVSYEGKTACEIEIPVSGKKADISETFVLPFAALLADDLVPEVTLTVVNEANGRVQKRLDAEHNVTVSRPGIGDILYIVDNVGGVFPISREEGFRYSTGTGEDLSGIGSSFVIASKLSGSAPDFSGIVWGCSNGSVASIDSDGEWIDTPSSEGYGFKNIGFDSYTFEINRLVNYSVTIDAATMDAQEQSGVNYLVQAGVQLVRNCEVVFEGFDELESMLQADRFEILGPKTAKFTGHSRKWTFFYDVNDNWMILNYVNFNEPEQVWVTGEKACFPLGNANSEHSFKYLSSDGKDRYATLAGVADEDGVYRCLLFLDDAFTIQLYSWVKWSTVITMNSLTTQYCEITADGIYMRPGNEFVPGVYMLRVKHTTMPNVSGDGAVADVSLEPYIPAE